MKRLVVAALAGAALAVPAAAPAAQAAAAPTGCVGRWHSPAGDTLDLQVFASPAAGATLASATLLVNGTPVATSALPAGTPACTDGGKPGVTGVPLSLNTRSFPDGFYRLVVTVADTDGGTATILDAQTEIWNARPVSSPSATLVVGSGTPAPQGSPGGSGGVAGATASSCRRPKLSVSLDQKPLRIRHGVPVLKRGKRYRFRGRLTCVVGHKRISAPKRTRIDRLDKVGRRTVPKGGGLVRGRGRVTFIVPALSSRTLIFRCLAGGRHTDVKIRIKVARR